MASRSEETKKPTSDRPEQRKKRCCLMCGTHFESSHFGERICSSCKGTAAWREGGFAA